MKPVGEAGGYGITVGPKATRAELDECRAKLVADPANYISQPCIKLSVAPTLVDGGIEPRHVDLRPFAVTGSRHLGVARRADPGRAAPRLAGRQFIAGRRVEGHLGPWLTFCSPATRIAFFGWRAMSSAPRTWRASSTSTRPSRATAAARQNWRSIIQLNADEEAFFAEGREVSAQSVLRFYVVDADNPTSIVSTLRYARENARTLRPLISTEMWVQLNVFYNHLATIGAAS